MAVARFHVHYLSRARERLTAEQELRALALWRDPGLARFLVAKTPLPAGTDRILIALDRGADPPCAIVTRDGVPIPCLAGGMRRRHWQSVVYLWMVDKLAAAYFASGRRGGTRVLPSST